MLCASSPSGTSRSWGADWSTGTRRERETLREPLVSVTWKWSPLLFLDGVKRTRTLGFRSVLPEPDADTLPPSKYSMSSEVWERLALWPRVLMVTGVPSSGSEYVDCSSPGLEMSVANSLGLFVSVSVGAGRGGGFLESTTMVAIGSRRRLGRNQVESTSSNC